MMILYTIFEFKSKGHTVLRRCIQEALSLLHKAFPVTLSMGRTEKSLIECPGELKYSEVVVTIP